MRIIFCFMTVLILFGCVESSNKFEKNKTSKIELNHVEVYFKLLKECSVYSQPTERSEVVGHLSKNRLVGVIGLGYSGYGDVIKGKEWVLVEAPSSYISGWIKRNFISLPSKIRSPVYMFSINQRKVIRTDMLSNLNIDADILPSKQEVGYFNISRDNLYYRFIDCPGIYLYDKVNGKILKHFYFDSMEEIGNVRSYTNILENQFLVVDYDNSNRLGSYAIFDQKNGLEIWNGTHLEGARINNNTMEVAYNIFDNAGLKKNNATIDKKAFTIWLNEPHGSEKNPGTGYAVFSMQLPSLKKRFLKLVWFNGQ